MENTHKLYPISYGDQLTKSWEMGIDDAIHMTKQEQKLALSISDLLKIRRQSYSHLFPLIDRSSYVSKVTRSIYNREELPASQEILPNLERKRSSACDYIDIHAEETQSKASSEDDGLNKKSPGKERNQSEAFSEEVFMAEELDCMSDLEDYLNYMRRERRGKETSHNRMMLRRRSMPLQVFESQTSSVLLPSLPARMIHPRSIWVGCIIDYMVLSRRLNVRLIHTGDMLEDIMDGKLIAKVFLLPGRIKKQKVAVKRIHSKSYTRVHFEKFSGPQLQLMAIGVKLTLSRGLFKRPYLLNEWMIPLSNVSLIGEHTAWQLFEWDF